MVFQGLPVSDPPENWKELERSVAQILTASGMDAEVQKTITLARGTVTVDVLLSPKRACMGQLYANVNIGTQLFLRKRCLHLAG